MVEQEIVVTQEKGSVGKGILRFIVVLLIIALVLAFAYGAWWLINKAIAEGWVTDLFSR